MNRARHAPLLVLAITDDKTNPQDDEIASALAAAQRMLLKYPFAARAIFAAFVAEGRRFAETPEGRRYKTELARSELIERGRALWEVGTLGILRERPASTLPSVIVDAFMRAASHRNFERFLERLLEGLL